MNSLTKDSITNEIKELITTQSYSKKASIDGLQIVELKRMAGEDGNFEELTRINENGELQSFPGFKLKQINRSKLLPQAIKAWHLHFSQEDIWYISPEDHMILGLWDVREDSPTKGIKMKVVMGGGISKLVHIPRGVAHGVVNIGHKPGTILYLVNEQFISSSPDEHRIPWDACGPDFWVPEKG